MELYIGIGVVLAILYFWYASIITKKNKAHEALSGIDVQLKKRSNLIPNVLKIAKKFMEHEKELLEEITRLRTEAEKVESAAVKDRDIQEQFNLENLMGGKMGQLMVAVENYPDLKSDTSMLEAQRAYSEVEEHIAAARRFYNSAVNELRNSIQIFPGNIIAGMARVTDMPMFEADEASKKPVNADDIF